LEEIEQELQGNSIGAASVVIKESLTKLFIPERKAAFRDDPSLWKTLSISEKHGLLKETIH